MGKTPVTVVVITKNEEANIADCLSSVHGWADEIIVVDDESRDKTVEIAQRYAEKVFHRRMDNEGKHRNWAYAQAKNEWVLSLDADEMVTPELREEITQALANTPYQSYTIPLRNYIGDYWVRHGGWYPAGKTRLFMKSRFKYEEVQVHPKAFLDGQNGFLTKDIVHKGYPDIEHFLGSVNRQTTLEAAKWLAAGRKLTFGLALWRAVDRFFRRYVGKRGYKDGVYGYTIALFDSIYQMVSYVKYCELKRRKHSN